MRLAELATTTESVRSTSSRTAKAEHLAALLSRLAPAEIVPAIGFLLAQPRQGAIGVGWATVARVDSAPTGPADATSDDGSDQTDARSDAGSDQTAGGPDILAFDRLLSEIATTTGAGSEAARVTLLEVFLEQCSPAEAEFVRRVLIGDARQGALGGVMSDAAARAAGVKAAVMRRAAMLSGDLAHAAAVALIEGPEALAAIDLEVGRPIQPMLASTSADVEEALAAVNEPESLASVEWKLDGARIQVHIRPSPKGPEAEAEVSIYTRNLNDVTDRLPQVIDVVRSFNCSSAVLDGEIMGLAGEQTAGDEAGDDGLTDNEPTNAEAGDESRPRRESDDQVPQAFQEVMSALSTESGPAASTLRPFFFDLMYLDGASLIDQPLRDRLAALSRLAPDHVIPQLFTDDINQAKAHLDQALDRGHEGVMIKAGSSTYAAGRRGKAWRKVKPVHTLDLVVLAAEWGHGRRQGWLSNLHLGALDPETGQPVMVGKTFKGLTDELLTWQTEQFLDRMVDDRGHTVEVRPDLVVEIALDGAQTSTRYPGGVALRFARVRGYRPDRDPATADTLDAVRALLPRSKSA